MKILAIETSCDETAVAVVEGGRKILSSQIASQIEMHRLYGGVVPELASRSHMAFVSQLCDQALAEASLTKKDIEAVAVTYAPGLIGALLVGMNFGKALAYGLQVPLIPVHHVRGHIASNYLSHPQLKPPFLCLCVSGGTTAWVKVEEYTQMSLLGGTRDDAVGECFDKVARVLGIGYPGGKPLDDLAQGGNPQAYALPRGKVDGAPLDMSFSGLKTASVNLIHNAEQKGESLCLPDFAASFSQAVCDSLLSRLALALENTGLKQVAVAGGVSANRQLRGEMEAYCQKNGCDLFLPQLSLCGDNAAMIGAQAFYEYQQGHCGDWDLNAYATRAVSQSYGE